MRKTAICVDLSEESFNQIKNLEGSVLLKETEVHLVHFFEIQVYTAEFTPFVFPTKDQYPEIEKTTLANLENLAKNLGVKAITECIFVHSKEDAAYEYLKNNHIDLAIVSTHEKHGLGDFFHSSFADYLTKYSPCDVLIVRPKK